MGPYKKALSETNSVYSCCDSEVYRDKVNTGTAQARPYQNGKSWVSNNRLNPTSSPASLRTSRYIHTLQANGWQLATAQLAYLERAGLVDALLTGIGPTRRSLHRFWFSHNFIGYESSLAGLTPSSGDGNSERM